MFFYDWLTIQQDFGQPLPLLSDTVCQYLRVVDGGLTGESSYLYQQSFQHKGSFCDSVLIRPRGSLLTVSGNPSRWGRLENLFGLDTIDKCVAVFNSILQSLGFPVFTKCTRIFYRQSPENSKSSLVSDGAIIKEIHITSNRAVGFDNISHYLSGLSTQPYRNSVPRLHSNGCSVDWLSKTGNANLIYPCVYDKGNELKLHSYIKIKNKFGDNSSELSYLNRVIDYCVSNGVVRFEQKLKSRFLKKEGLSFWGLSDYSVLSKLHENFILLDQKLSVNAMDIQSISTCLIDNGIVYSVKSANTTAFYAMEWFSGKIFDFSKKSVQTHRARLRKIGIDIAQKCNISKFSPVVVKNVREITVTDLLMPDWYDKPVYLKRVA